MICGLENISHDVKDIVVCGAGNYGRKISEFIKNNFDKARICFFDTYKTGRIDGFDIINDLEKMNNKDNSIAVVASINFYNEILDILKKANFKEKNIVIPAEILLRKISELEKVVNKRIPKKRMRIVVDIASHCNLNCKGCDHFSPIAEEHFLNIESFKSDIKRLSELFVGDYELYQVGLEGGEPLLNSDINEYIRIIHNYLPSTKIVLLSNGTLLGKQNKEFWEACRYYSVSIHVTRYPINFDYEMIEKIAKKANVELVFWSGGDCIKTLDYKPINLNGDSDKYESFSKCYMGNDECTTLKEGKIYLCTFAPNLDRFTKYFDKKLELCNKDYVDIYRVNSAKEIMEYLCNPIPACRYCQPDKWTHGNVWDVSKKEIGEWV